MDSSNENRAIIQQLYSAADAGELDAMMALFSLDLQDHDANSARGGHASAYEALKMAFGEFLRGFPDTRHTVHDIIAEGNKVVVRVSAEGTQTGPAFGHPPSGRRFRNDAIVIYRLSQGKIVEKWGRERLGIVEQLETVSD